MTSVILDTHILVWSREKRGEPVAISAITLREIAWMVACGKLTSPFHSMPGMDEIESNPS